MGSGAHCHTQEKECNFNILEKSEVLKSNSLVRDSGAHQSPSFEDKETCHPGQQPLKVTPWDKPALCQDEPLFPEEVAGNRLQTCLAAFLQPDCPMASFWDYFSCLQVFTLKNRDTLGEAL